LPEALLAHETHGLPRESALLLVHPMGTDHRFWEECIAFRRDQYCCVAFARSVVAFLQRHAPI
jgi:hypothetical protein